MSRKFSKLDNSASTFLTESELMTTVRSLLEQNDAVGCEGTNSCNDYDKTDRPGMGAPLGWCLKFESRFGMNSKNTPFISGQK